MQEESMGAKIVKWLVILVFLPVICVADVINIKDSAPQLYVVKKGDTLWDISTMYLDKPWLWPELWRNNVHITNPHLIYPGDELRLRYNEQGEPVLEVVREEPKAQVKLSPSGRKIVKMPSPIDMLPWSVLEPYVDKDSVMSEQAYRNLPHLLGNQQGSVRFSAGDLVLSRASRSGEQNFRIVRMQNEIRDENDNLLGLQVRHVADAQLLDSDLEEQMLVKVKQGNFEAKRGDKLMPDFDSKHEALKLQPATDQRGKIIDSLEQHGLLGKYDVVIVNIGSESIEPGTVMGVYMQGPTILDNESPLYEHENTYLKSAFSSSEEIKQPALKVGELVVFKVFENVSYGILTRSTKAIRNGAIVGNP
jgi:hypothetical protein